MDLRDSPEHAEFRRSVETFLAVEWTGKEADDRDEQFVAAFRRKATDAGYLYRAIPRNLGGSEQAVDVIKAQIIRECFSNTHAPMELPGVGIQLLVPTLLECGEAWQQEMFIPPTLRGEYRWAQGYSEPGAGSDLASLQTRAELSGDEWVISGQKIWTTLGHQATHLFVLARTEQEQPRHEGISYLLVDARQPGITVRRIRQINGGAEFAETFFDGVRTPANWMVGKRGEGWRVANATLKHERNAVGSSARTLPMFDRLVKLAKRAQFKGRPALEDPTIRDRLAKIAGEVQAQLWAGYYQLTLDSIGEAAPLLSLTNKIVTTNINMAIADVVTDILNGRGLLMPPGEHDAGGDEKWVRQVLGSIAVAIAGGTSNIQRNIIAERGLGLPRSRADLERDA